MSEHLKKQKENESGGADHLPYPMVGKSKASDSIVKQIPKLSKDNKDLTIVGESGVGKGTIAKNIYALNRSDAEEKPMQSINLSIADDNEVEEMLFGYERQGPGSAVVTKKGFIELGVGGTILLEEIEEASFRNQMKILAFLEERTSRRIGAYRSEAIDIRVIITAKDDLDILFEQHKLYEDLYRKIREYETVRVPPLRERPEDIPLLVKYFSSQLSTELGLGELIIDINAIDILIRQPWKENIRELKAVVDKSVMFSSGGRFMLPPELVDEKTEVVKMLTNIETGQEFVLERSLDIIEKGIIERSLRRFGFNQSRAAGFLGLTEQTLRYKLKRLGIQSSRIRARI
ncbi:MAG: sigma-54-dependent Fis family transcriptional regulator [Bacteroidetes bacterium]|nr:MAG: sigma-54-dependent Fis family transcriptional regulator [Bacteroidota bacterium]